MFTDAGYRNLEAMKRDYNEFSRGGNLYGGDNPQGQQMNTAPYLPHLAQAAQRARELSRQQQNTSHGQYTAPVAPASSTYVARPVDLRQEVDAYQQQQDEQARKEEEMIRNRQASQTYLTADTRDAAQRQIQQEYTKERIADAKYAEKLANAQHLWNTNPTRIITPENAQAEFDLRKQNAQNVMMLTSLGTGLATSPVSMAASMATGYSINKGLEYLFPDMNASAKTGIMIGSSLLPLHKTGILRRIDSNIANRNQFAQQYIHPFDYSSASPELGTKFQQFKNFSRSIFSGNPPNTNNPWYFNELNKYGRLTPQLYNRTQAFNKYLGLPEVNQELAPIGIKGKLYIKNRNKDSYHYNPEYIKNDSNAQWSLESFLTGIAAKANKTQSKILEGDHFLRDQIIGNAGGMTAKIGPEKNGWTKITFLDKWDLQPIKDPSKNVLHSVQWLKKITHKRGKDGEMKFRSIVKPFKDIEIGPLLKGKPFELEHTFYVKDIMGTYKGIGDALSSKTAKPKWEISYKKPKDVN